MYRLRDYQTSAVENFFGFVAKNPGAHPLVIMPTGSGKSVVLAKMIEKIVTHPTYPARVLVTTHVKELVEQDAEKLEAILGPGMVGVYSAGLGRRDTDHPVIVAGVQSIAHRIDELTKAGPFGAGFVDECHLVPKDGFGRYRSMIHALNEKSPGMVWTGLTATPFRMRGGYLHSGEGRIFTHVAHSVDVVDLIAKGYLSPLVAKRPANVIDVTGVRVQHGEFVERDLEEIVTAEDRIEAAVAEIVHRGRDRHSWLVFCVSVRHAEAVRDEIEGHGVRTALITGQTSKPDRARIIADYREGRIRCLVNVNVLTTGFDAPATDLLAVLRPTQSAALYVQMMGRGMRIAEGKKDCLVLDFGTNVERHGPLNAIDVDPDDPDDEPGVAPTKTCPECESILHAALRECPDCGFQFPEPEVKHETKAAEVDLIAAPKSSEIEVAHVHYGRHKGKDGKPDTLRVEYLCGVRVLRQWFAFEPDANPVALKIGAEFWRERSPGRAVPASVAEALERAAQGELRMPSALRIEERPGSRFPEIKARIG